MSAAEAVGNESIDVHEAAELFPMLPDDELAKLAEDIKKNGQHEPVVVLDGKVLDGRNRLRACDKAGVEPKIEHVRAEVVGDPFAYVVSRNFHRRHLRPHESGKALASYMEHIGAVSGKTGRPKKSDTVSDILGTKTLPQAAEELGIGERTARRHLKAHEEFETLPPSFKQEVTAGNISGKKAAKIARLDNAAKHPVGDGPEPNTDAKQAPATRRVACSDEEWSEQDKLRKWLRTVHNRLVATNKAYRRSKWDGQRNADLSTQLKLVEKTIASLLKKVVQ